MRKLPGKGKSCGILGILGDESAKTKLLSASVVALMVLTAFAGLFLMTQNAAASTYTYTENFDDDTTGAVSNGTNPDATWYNVIISDTSGYSIDATTYHGTSGKSLRCNHDGTGSKELDLDLTTASAIDYCQYYTYFHAQKMYLIFADADYTGNCDITSLNENAGPWIIVDSSNIAYKDSTGTIQTIVASSGIVDTWTLWNFTFNYTTNKFQVVIGANTYGWYDFRASIDSVAKIIFWDGDGYASDFYIDDIEIGSPTDLGGTTNTPPTCSITSPSNGATVSGTVSIQGTASDTDGTVQSVEVKIGSDAWATASGTTSWSFSWDTTGYSDGDYTILARAYDGTDYSTNASITVTVDNIQDVSPSVALSGLTSGQITWNGSAGDVVWCNSSGSGTETVTVTITGGSGSLDADVDQINITTSDLTGTNGTIADTNLVVYASVDNTNWYDFGSPSSHMVYLNATTWTAGDDPFPITGDDTIYLRFKLTIPSGTSDGTYTASGWKVAIVDITAA